MRHGSVLSLAALCFGILFLASPVGAIPEGVPCSPEPTDMVITYGSLITCEINPVGDTDTFRFQGSQGDQVLVGSLRLSVQQNTNVTLYRPDGTELARTGGTNIISATLDQTGRYTLVASEFFGTHTTDYTLALERLVPPSASATPISPNTVLSDELNPPGDLDLFIFQADAGTTVSILAVRQNGAFNVCVTLYRPDGTQLPGATCNGSVVIDAMLDQTGTYTIRVNGHPLDVQTLGYTLTLTCIVGSCVTPPRPEVSLGDVNQDGRITPADALCVFRRFLGLPSCLD